MSERTNPREAATEVVRTLRRAGHRALFAGGCVRDGLLAVEPKDYDVATSARPDEVIACFPRTQPVGAAFGVVLVMIGEVAVEVATFRRDGPYSDGRRPDRVEYSTPEEDAARRDFTINAMFLDPETGEVIDYVGGRADLDARLLRTVGDATERFAEDKLRVLRAIRFAARFDLAIDPALDTAARAAASGLAAVSRERKTDELGRILVGPRVSRAAEMLIAWRVLPVVLPRVAPGPAIVERLRALPEARSPALAWSALLWGTTPAASFPDLRLSRETETAVAATTKAARAMPTFLAADMAAQKRLARADGFRDGLVLAAICGDVTDDDVARIRARAAWSPVDLRPPLWLDGNDLIALGVPKGPSVGRALRALEDAALREELPDRAAAERLVRGMA